jgi:hypothetical protein
MSVAKGMATECRDLYNRHSFFNNGDGDLVIRIDHYLIIRWVQVDVRGIYGYIVKNNKHIQDFDEFRADEKILKDIERILLLG